MFHPSCTLRTPGQLCEYQKDTGSCHAAPHPPCAVQEQSNSESQFLLTAFQGCSNYVRLEATTLAAWLSYLLYSVTSVCTEEMKHSGKSCCHGSSTAVAVAAAAAAAGIPKNAPEEASHRQASSPKFPRGLLWNLGQEEPQV